MIKLDVKTIAAITASIVLLVWLAKRQASKAVQAVNPLNNHNVFAQAANGLTDALSAGASKTTGDAWYKHCKARNFAPWYCPTP